MKKKILLSVLVLLLLAATSICIYIFDDYSHRNNIIFYGGTILTMDDKTPTVEAMFIKDGKIEALGNQDQIFKLKTSKTELINLDGKTLMPGFFDAHGHNDLSSFLYGMTDISGFNHKTPAAVWQVAAEKVKVTPSGEWIICKGFDPILTKGLHAPTIQFLDSLSPKNPLLLISQSLHSFYGNSLAFKKVGITNKTKDPTVSSYFEKDKDGNLTGLIAEQEAFEPFRVEILEVFKKSLAENATKVMFENAKAGVTSISTLGLSAANKNILMLYEHLSAGTSKPLYKFLELIGKLPERKPNVRHFIYLRYDAPKILIPESVNNGDDFYKILGFKYWYDGSPYIGSMYLKEPYLHSELTEKGFHLPEFHRGEALIKQEDLLSSFDFMQSKGFQIAIHAQGDNAIQEVVSVFEKLNKKYSIEKYRNRLEHCLLLPRELMPQMKKLNLTPSFHINHILYYGDALKNDILGQSRSEKILPINSFVQQQQPFSLHSDQPMYQCIPLLLLNTAVNRISESGTVLGKEEKISVLEGLKALTIYAAWQFHCEDKLGSFVKNKYADMVLLDKNPLLVNPDEIKNINVLQTFVAGKSIFLKK